MSQEIYLDNNATTQPLPAVRAAILETLGPGFGNPSSTHAAGDRARAQLGQARQSVARLLGATGVSPVLSPAVACSSEAPNPTLRSSTPDPPFADNFSALQTTSDGPKNTGETPVPPEKLTFTSSGTEANNLALHSAISRSKASRPRLVTTAAEHSSILKMAEHLERREVDVVILPVDRDGLIDVEQLDRAMVPGTALVSVHWVNNETGVIQPIEQIARLCAARGVPFHTDACQAFGKLPLTFANLPIDLVTVTAHKLHGPQGAAVLYARQTGWLVPLLFGGPQENNHRAGTENMPGIVGFGAAAEIRAGEFNAAIERLTRLRDQFEDRVLQLIPDVTINGCRDRRVCNTTNLCFHGLDGQALVARLDQAHIRCSQSSACTNQRPEPSYVLRAMGLTEEDAYASIRFSFGAMNTEAEVETAAVILQDLCGQLRAFAAKLHNPYHANVS